MFPLSHFLIYCFVTAYTPGANNLLSLANAARVGLRRSIRFNLGVTAGFFVVMSLCTVFISALYAVLPKVELVMKILGAAYMLYLAWKTWRSSSLEVQGQNAASFRSGMLLQFMNPKIYIYAITAMSLYILPLYHSVPALCFFVLVLSVIGASGTYVWALFGSVFCAVFAKYPKPVNAVMALLLVYCAAALFL